MPDYGNWPREFWGWITKDSISFFTFVLAVVAAAQGALIWRQIRLARDEFLASHRPKIRVRAVDFDGKLCNGDNIVINFTCVNIGDSPCEVVGASYIFSVTEKNAAPTKRKKMSNIEFPKPIKLAAGEPAKFTTHAVNGEEARILGGNWDFWGMIEYRDTSGVMRLTGFWRRFEARTNDFTTPDNPDFNYEY